MAVGAGLLDATALADGVGSVGSLATRPEGLAPGLDPGSGVDPAISSLCTGLAVWAPGAGNARGRNAAPIAIAPISVGTSAAATNRVERV